MTSKHTPGPWTIKSVFPDRSRGQTFGPRVWISAKVNNLNCRLADIPDIESPTSDLLADARLIAAAPDLLAALQTLVAASNDASINVWSALTDAREAIAKAVQS
jgi:hypothetical protein